LPLASEAHQPKLNKLAWLKHYLAQGCSSVSAATMSGYDALYNKLSIAKGHVDKKVLNQMITSYAAATPLASQELLSEFYDLAKASPMSSTKASLNENEGLVFKVWSDSGGVMAGTSSRCATTCSFVIRKRKITLFSRK